MLEAEEIVAKYSSMKPLLSRPSSSIAAQRFGTAALPHVALMPPVPDGGSSSLAMHGAPSPAPSFRITQHTPNRARSDLRSSSFRDASPLRGDTAAVEKQDLNDTPGAGPAPPNRVLSPKRSIRQVHQTPQQTPTLVTAHSAQRLPNPVSDLDSTQYSENIRIFSDVARDQQIENQRLRKAEAKMKEQVVIADLIKRDIEEESYQRVSATQEHCSRQILSMRKSLLLSEQAAGSLRTENEALYNKATENELLHEELDMWKTKYNDAEQRLVILAQQNSALQRALKQKEADCQADLDLYVKQLDVVQVQNGALKKELEILTINARQQSALESEIERLGNKNAELQEAIQSLNREVSSMQERMEVELREKDDECAREVLNHRRHAVGLEGRVTSLQNQLEAYLRKQKPSVQQQQIVELTKKIDTLSAVLVEQEHHKETIGEAAERIALELQREKRVSNDIRAQLAFVSSQLADEKAAHQLSRKELSTVTDSLSRAVAEVSERTPTVSMS